MAKSQTIHRKARGLYTSYNPYQTPEGALLEAENVEIDRENVISKARGFNRYGDATTNAPTQLLQYKDKVIVQDGTTISYDSDDAGTWADWTGSYSAPSSDHKIRAVEARSNIWFTTSNGPYRNDAINGTPREAGLPEAKCIDPHAWGQTVTNGWLAPGYFVAYKYLYVRTDAYGRKLYSEPSDRWIYENTGTTTLAVGFTAEADVNSLIISSDEVHIYRTPSAASVDALGDTYKLVDIVTYAGTNVTYWDYVPDDFLGEELYTNATREGLAGVNRKPPFAHDIAYYKGYMFCANVRRQNEIKIRLKVDAADMNDGDTIKITYGAKNYTFTARTSMPGTYEFLIGTGSTESIRIEETMRSFAFAVTDLHTDSPTSYPFFALYTSDTTSLDGAPGEVTIRVADFATDDLEVLGSSNLEDMFTPNIYDTAATRAQAAEKNVLCYSKFEEPNAVPPGNFERVGSEDSAILRILPLRNSLIILKEEGVWRLTGETESDFIIEAYDPTVRIDAPETAVVLNNAVYCSSNQGVVRIDETMGVVILSRPIEEDLRVIQNFSNYATVAHATAYESERQYWLWVPDSASDTYAKTCYKYNYINKSWVTRKKNCSCAMVLHDNKTMYLGHGVDTYVLKERKSLSGTADFMDESMTSSMSAVSTTTDDDGNTVSLVTCAYTYTGAALGVGWHFQYSTEEAVVEAASDNGDGTYNLTLSHLLSLPGGSSGSGSFFDILHFITGGVSAGSGVSLPVNVTLSIPIVSTVTWVPETAGNPATMKQFSRCQIEVEDNRAYKQEIEFISNFINTASAENILKTPGWGTGRWDSPAWGSNVPSIPIMTYIPQNYQRCQWLRPTFVHRYAKEYFNIVSLALTFRVTSDRTVLVK